jgi:hypothetical protein
MLGAQRKTARKLAFPSCVSRTEILVRLAGIEPTTPWFVAKYSIQLSYSREALNYNRVSLRSTACASLFRMRHDIAPETTRISG